MKVIADEPLRTTRKYREIKPVALIRQRFCRQTLFDRRERLFTQAEKWRKSCRLWIDNVERRPNECLFTTSFVG